MPEWALAAMAAAGVSAITSWVAATLNQGQLVGRIEARLSTLLDNLKDDVKDMQRSKLDISVHDVTVKRLDSDIQYVRHAAANANQRVGVLEQNHQRSRP